MQSRLSHYKNLAVKSPSMAKERIQAWRNSKPRERNIRPKERAVDDSLMDFKLYNIAVKKYILETGRPFEHVVKETRKGSNVPLLRYENPGKYFVSLFREGIIWRNIVIARLNARKTGCECDISPFSSMTSFHYTTESYFENSISKLAFLRNVWNSKNSNWLILRKSTPTGLGAIFGARKNISNTTIITRTEMCSD